jgi:DNA-binding transcriptional LysR family regulator
MLFTLRQLEYFVATCDAGSFTEAALNIPVAQSSVSTAIAQLELALGVQLLIRHHAQGVSTTPAGRRFLAQARALLLAADDLQRFAAELTEEISGTLELGCLVTLAPLVMARLCQTFMRRYPGVDVQMTEAGQDQLMHGLRVGELAAALTYDLELSGDVEFQDLASLPPYALVAADHPLTARAEATLAELAELPLVMLDLPLSRDYFRELFLRAGLEPSVAQRSPHIEVVRALVGNGFGYTILNARALNSSALDGRPLASVPIAGPTRPMTVGLATLSTTRRTRVTQAFVAHCRDAMANHEIPALEP